MVTRTRTAFAVLLILAAAFCVQAQDAAPAQAPAGSASAAPAQDGICQPEVTTDDAAATTLLPLRVPQGFPLQIELDREVHIREAGQAIHGKTAEPVYAFDRIVIPAGTEVNGHIAVLEDVSKKQRTLSALNANFTPDHRLEITFDELVLSDGTHIPVRTSVTQGSGQVMEFVRSKEGEEKQGAKSVVGLEIDRAKAEARKDWDLAKKELTEPGRMHRLERYVVAQLPFHPQYLDTGTFYFAELREPLDFGATPLTPQLVASMARPAPPDSVVHALLVTPLSSATAQRDDQVEAVLSQPLFDRDDLIRPAGTRLTGIVLQAHPAHKLHHNGQVRLKFQDLANPYGQEQKVSGMLVGVAAQKSEHIQLDSEGGAQSTAAPTRYLSTGIAVGLALASSQTDHDAPDGGVAGKSSDRAAGGAAGFKLIGLALTLSIHSQPLGLAMGALGATRSIYSNFLGPGQELTFPKHTPMEVNLSPEHVPPTPKPVEAAAGQEP